MTLPALLFDLDGTLIDSARDIARALTRVSQARGGGAASAETVRPLVSQGVATLVRQALGPVAGARDADIDAFRAALAALPVDPAIVYPGVRTSLDALSATGHPMAVVTNKPERLARAVLVELALDHHFGAIIGGDTAAHPKPHRAPVDHALGAIGGSAGNSLFIGDSAVDAATASDCSIPFLLYEGGYGAADCSASDVMARFAHFEVLPDMIASFTRRAGRA